MGRKAGSQVGRGVRRVFLAFVRLGHKKFSVPGSKPIRLALGFLLIVGGILGFLPILGFWMIPLGLLVLSIDLVRVRRWRRNFAVWWGHRRRPPGSRR